jgi:hypothetical protein
MKRRDSYTDSISEFILKSLISDLYLHGDKIVLVEIRNRLPVGVWLDDNWHMAHSLGVHGGVMQARGWSGERQPIADGGVWTRGADAGVLIREWSSKRQMNPPLLAGPCYSGQCKKGRLGRFSKISGKRPRASVSGHPPRVG